jgi:hypothetical protein
VNGKSVFIKEAFSEDNGKASFSRISTFIILVFELGWITFVTLSKGTIPDLGGPALFLVTLYGANKAATVASDIATGTKETSKS